MNVLYVLDRFPAVSETFVLNELLELERQGDAVHVAARRPSVPGEPLHDGAAELAARALRSPPAMRLLPAAAAALAARPRRAFSSLAWCVRARLRERGALRAFGEAAWLERRLPRGVDRVHAHFAHGSATVALVLGRLAGLPFSFTAHALDVFAAGDPALLRRKIAEARLVVAVSEHTHSYLTGLARPEDRNRIVVVRNGVDHAAFASPTARDVPSLVLTVGRLVEKKGVDTAVATSALLRRRGVAHTWEIIGDGVLKAALEAPADAAGVTLAGAREHSYVRNALARAAVFALPCRIAADGDRDALPVALVEAMAAGVPVVSTAVGGVPELVHDGETGLLVPPDDPAALADAVERLLRDVALAARLAAAGRIAAAEYDLSACVSLLREQLAAAA